MPEPEYTITVNITDDDIRQALIDSSYSLCLATAAISLDEDEWKPIVTPEGFKTDDTWFKADPDKPEGPKWRAPKISYTPKPGTNEGFRMSYYTKDAPLVAKTTPDRIVPGQVYEVNSKAAGNVNPVKDAKGPTLKANRGVGFRNSMLAGPLLFKGETPEELKVPVYHGPLLIPGRATITLSPSSQVFLWFQMLPIDKFGSLDLSKVTDVGDVHPLPLRINDKPSVDFGAEGWPAVADVKKTEVGVTDLPTPPPEQQKTTPPPDTD